MSHHAAGLLSTNDQRFLAMARTLGDRDWATDSLCTEWSNHEVLAHLVLGYRVSLGALTRTTLRHRGHFDAGAAAMARDLAATSPPEQLLREFDELRLRPRGVGRVFPRRLLLGDHVIHELDITVALGRRPTIPIAILLAVLDTEVGVPNPFVPARRRASGLHLEATDTNWRSGGHRPGRPMVTGGAADLVSVLAGRPCSLDRLSGDGVPLLRDRLAVTW